jgi:hypothetical protein
MDGARCFYLRAGSIRGIMRSPASRFRPARSFSAR